MNYFAHGRLFLDEPYVLAGTAVPDWLGAVDRRVRVRARAARPFLSDTDARVAALARGIVRHHDDDRWFHQTAAFAQLSMRFSQKLRAVLPDDDGMRPSFVGHILVEILLDAHLIEEDPSQLDRYYQALGEVDPQLIESTIKRMAPPGTDRLGALLPKFSSERFLSDYADDAKLGYRLNQVMRRVGLPQLPESIQRVLADARREVKQQIPALLTIQARSASE